MSWLYLVLAGLFEIGWPVGLKIAQESTTRWSGILIAVVFMVLSGFLLWLAHPSSTVKRVSHCFL